MPVHASLLIIANAQTAATILEALEPQYWVTQQVELGDGSLSAAEQLEPSLVILDARQAGQSFADFCRTFRSVQGMRSVPLIALVESGACSELVAAGADECWTEPIDDPALHARLARLHRRSDLFRSSRLVRHGGIVLHLDRYVVCANGMTARLTESQVRVLQFFMENPSTFISRKQLLERVWRNENLEENTVAACVSRLGKVLASAGVAGSIRSLRTAGGYIFDG